MILPYQTKSHLLIDNPFYLLLYTYNPNHLFLIHLYRILNNLFYQILDILFIDYIFPYFVDFFNGFFICNSTFIIPRCDRIIPSIYRIFNYSSSFHYFFYRNYIYSLNYLFVFTYTIQNQNIKFKSFNNLIMFTLKILRPTFFILVISVSYQIDLLIFH